MSVEFEALQFVHKDLHEWDIPIGIHRRLGTLCRSTNRMEYNHTKVMT